MRGKRTHKTRSLSFAFVLIMLVALISGCSVLRELSSSGLSGSGIPGAAAAVVSESPTETAAPEEAVLVAADRTETATPSEVTPYQEDPTPSPVIPDKDKFKDKKLVALTFDDGPDNKYTTQILDLLKEYDVKATFFMVGLQVEKYPDTAKRIAEEGHSIGNHSWSHADLSKLSSKARDEELDRAQQAIIEATGMTPHLMRAPYGAISDSVLQSIHDENMKHVFWTVDTRDWAGSSVTKMHENVLDNTHKGGIILMHSFGGRKHAIERTVKLLPSIIKDLREMGYEFATVDELIESGQAHSSVIK